MKSVPTHRSAIALASLLGFLAAAPQARAESPAVAKATVESTTIAGAGLLLERGMQRAIEQELRRSEVSLAPNTTSVVAQDDGTPERKRGIGRVILGAATGAVAGFFGGAYLGASLEPNCHCDDPGLRGVLIGAPIGAVVGGIVGGKWFFR